MPLYECQFLEGWWARWPWLPLDQEEPLDSLLHFRDLFLSLRLSGSVHPDPLPHF